jgi:hypothetical protein
VSTKFVQIKALEFKLAPLQGPIYRWATSGPSWPSCCTIPLNAIWIEHGGGCITYSLTISEKGKTENYLIKEIKQSHTSITDNKKNMTSVDCRGGQHIFLFYDMSLISSAHSRVSLTFECTYTYV